MYDKSTLTFLSTLNTHARETADTRLPMSCSHTLAGNNLSPFALVESRYRRSFCVENTLYPRLEPALELMSLCFLIRIVCSVQERFFGIFIATIYGCYVAEGLTY